MSYQSKPSSTISETNDPVAGAVSSQEYLNSLRAISEEDFANLGMGRVVYVRSISARALKEFLPEADSMPGDVQFQMIVGADGAPIVITDSQEAIDDWFAQNNVESLPRH